MKEKLDYRGNRVKKICRAVSLAVFGMILLNGCGVDGSKVSSSERTEKQPGSTEYSTEVFAMDTYMTLTAYGKRAKEAVEAAAKEIDRIEQLVSAQINTSEISQINQQGKSMVSDDTMYLMKRSMELYQSTSQAFDITIYPVMQEWGFPTGDYHVPEESKLDELLKFVDSSYITADEKSNTVTVQKPGVKLDLGGIAKGYTSARIMEIFKDYGIQSGVVNLGGNVQVLGNKTSGEPWKVGIENPEEKGSYMGVLHVSDKAVITSGGYERYFEEAGKEYHHIIDPATGYPASSGLLSATIISDDGTLADGLSTSLFVMGKEKAIAYWKENKENFDFILETEDGEILVSDGIADNFHSDFKLNVVEG